MRRRAFDRLAQALSLVFGVEVLIVLKDIWGLDGAADASCGAMGGQALVRAALDEKGGATTAADNLGLAPHLVRPDNATETRLSIWRDADALVSVFPLAWKQMNFNGFFRSFVIGDGPPAAKKALDGSRGLVIPD